MTQGVIPYFYIKSKRMFKKLHLLHTDAANFNIKDSEEEIKLQTRH
jgi:hypothetical protein